MIDKDNNQDNIPKDTSNGEGVVHTVRTSKDHVLNILNSLPVLDSDNHESSYTYPESGNVYRVSYQHSRTGFGNSISTQLHGLMDVDELRMSGFSEKTSRETSLQIRLKHSPKVHGSAYINCGFYKFSNVHNDKSTRFLVIHDIIVDDRGQGVGTELWEIAEFLAREHGDDFIIAFLVAEKGEYQERWEGFAQGRGYEVQDRKAVLYSSPQGKEKYQFFKRGNELAKTFAGELYKQGYRWHNQP